MTILVIADHDNKSLKTETYKTIAAANMLTTFTSSNIHVLVIGKNIEAVAKKVATAQGITKVLVVDNEHYKHHLAENISDVVVQLAEDYSHILTSSTSTGKNFMPRVAALLDVEQISDVIAIKATDTFIRPIYAGNALATIHSWDRIKIMTIRTSAFNAVSTKNDALIESIECIKNINGSRFVGSQIIASDRPELASANIVISGGRGMRNSDNFKLLEGIADKLGAGIGASRAAVDAGFVANDMQIGQTGKIVAPNLYIAVGISGAIQHLAGMKDSTVIVAINEDEKAPIFQVADYGLVGDLFEILPELESQL
jgi:electron transfer flavoprotein alpha subunit